jgi:hypothetical protein
MVRRFVNRLKLNLPIALILDLYPPGSQKITLVKPARLPRILGQRSGEAIHPEQNVNFACVFKLHTVDIESAHGDAFLPRRAAR